MSPETLQISYVARGQGLFLRYWCANELAIKMPKDSIMGPRVKLQQDNEKM